MKFGDIYIGTGRQAVSNTQRWKGEFLSLYTFPVLTFIMERPDDGRVIVESEHGLFHERKAHLLPVNDDTLQQLTDILHEKYGRKIALKKEEIDEKDLERLAAKEHFDEAQSHIEYLRALNAVSPSENREKTIRQNEKHLRRQERKVSAIQATIDELRKAQVQIQRNHQASVEYLEQQLMELLKKQH